MSVIPISSNNTVLRPDGRAYQTLRPVKILCHINRYAEGSCLFQMGHTHVMCTVSVEENKVPSHIQQGGWLTAEYAMLPRATHQRSSRDRTPAPPNSRAREIQRLIGRSLRAMVNLSQIGKRTLMVDCDVLQADGGTRCAAINGGAIALKLALQRLVLEEKIASLPLSDSVVAVSVCHQNKHIIIDPDYQEDSQCDMDLNLVGNQTGDVIEIQGSSEGEAIALPTMIDMINKGIAAHQQLLAIMDEALTHQNRVC